MNCNDYWEVIYFKKNQRIQDGGERHICDTKSQAEVLRACADFDMFDVLVNHFINGNQVYSKYYT